MQELVDSRTVELIVTNAVLGVVCTGLIAAVLGGVVAELLARRRERREGRRAEPAAAPPPRPRSLAEMKGELPDGWPPLPDGRKEARRAQRR